MKDSRQYNYSYEENNIYLKKSIRFRCGFTIITDSNGEEAAIRDSEIKEIRIKINSNKINYE